MSFNVIWIDPNVSNDQNSKYASNLETLKHINLKKFFTVNEGINYLKTLKFENVIIIVSSRPYPELVSCFKRNITKMKIIPKIIVFTGNKNVFLKYNPDYYSDNNAFYSSGDVQIEYTKMRNFIENEIKNLNINDNISQEKNYKLNKFNESQLMFEYINCKEKLILPLCFKSLIGKISDEIIEKYINNLYDTYSKENNEIKNLLNTLKTIQKIPIEILSKYFIGLYTLESNFYKKINKDLEANKIEEHLPFIKILYEGIKLKSFSISHNTSLYCASKISANDLNIIKYNMKNKIKDLPSTVAYTKSFLSFTKDKNIALGILNSIKDNNLLKVLYIIDKDETIYFNISTQADIEEISFFANNKEVLFFPFSSFEIKEINEINNSNEIIYEVKLSYLSKYLKEIKDDKNIIQSDIKSLESDYKKSLFSSGLINNQEKIVDILNEFDNYEKDVELKIIYGEILVDNYNKHEDIQIINYNDYYYDNKKQIEENCEININGEKIDFSFKHKFQKEGIYKIKYIFQKSLDNTSYMFSHCKCIANLDLSNFYTKNVTNMEYMFENCKSLKNLNLSIYNTKNVTNMRGMFSGCESLTNLDLSYFNTKNVVTTYRMFDGCKSLISLDLSNFDTYNVTNMDYMFADCSSLFNLDLSNFNIQNVVYMRNFLYGCNSLNNFKSSFNNMMNNNYNIYANNNQMMNGNNIMNNMNYNMGINNNNGYMPNINNFQNNVDNINLVNNNNNEIILNFFFNNNISFFVKCKLDEKLSDVIERFQKTQCPQNLQNSLDFPLFSGNPIQKEKKLFELGLNNNDIICFSYVKNDESENMINENQELREKNISNNVSNKKIEGEKEIFVKEHSHKLVYCISLLDWNCSICKNNFNKNNVKYYCSLCDFNLCEKCHSERNLPKRSEFKEEVKPSNSKITNLIIRSIFHEHNLIYCRTSRLKDKLTGWYCDVCKSLFPNEIWSFYCTHCDYDLCCKCAGFN